MDLENVKLLLVEDSEAERIEYITMLKDIGIKNITVATDGLEAMRMVANQIDTANEFDVVLTDYQLPKFDGMQLLKTLKQNPASAHIPVVYMSSKGDFSVVTEFIKAGVAQMLVKPINKDELKHRLTLALDKKA